MNRPLAIFSPDHIGLGVATFVRRHMRDLLPGGTAVVAFAASPESGEPEWGVDGPILDLGRIIGGRLRWQLAHAVAKQVGVKLDRVMIKRFLKQHQVQVVMGEYLDFSLQWLGIAQELGIRFFAHAHGCDVVDRLREPKWRTEYLRYNRAGGIISNSQANRDELVALGLAPSKIHVVHCGVDVSAEPVTRQEREEIRCIAVGRVVPEKAPVLLLDAFRRAAMECPRLRLDYVGDGPLFPAALEFVRAFNLQDKVTLHGACPNEAVLGLMKEADIFIQHSLQEGLGVAILEGMAQALPVVATRTGGIPETVVDGATGFLVEPGDSAELAERILVLSRDPDLRRRMGVAGWRRAKDHFTWEKERAELLQVLGLPLN
ncbi:MAG: glycosyltransferase family 4 protein [Acidobacteria bacterium]|nr:glycosyltransferase family 4 protein [Acidobacteriota bacterium]